MASGSGSGIAQLLSAEKRAAEKVAEAKKRKNKRLKQAKEEAQEEIAKYKAEGERAFKESEASKGSGVTDVQAQIVKDTNTKISSMSSGVVTNKEAVIVSFWTKYSMFSRTCTKTSAKELKSWN